MFHVAIQEELMTHAEQQVSKHNFGQRYTGNGTREQQITGVAAQSKINELFGLPLVDGSSGFDGGVDLTPFGVRTDVKTMGRTCPPRREWPNNFFGLQMGYDVDAILFCSFNKIKKILTVCGWCTKDELKAKAILWAVGSVRKRDDGTSFTTQHDLYEMMNTDLRDVSSIEDLLSQLEAYSRVLHGEIKQDEEEPYDESWFKW